MASRSESRSNLYYRILVAVLALGVVLQVLQRVHSELGVQRPATQQFVIGDTLPGVNLYSPAQFLTFLGPRTRLNSLFARCGVLIFFRTTCPWCERAALAWEGVDSVRIAGAQLPVFWVGSREDDEASSWLQRHRFTNGFTIKEKSWWELGVTAVPQFYLLDSDGLLLATGIVKRDNAGSVLSEESLLYQEHCTLRTDSSSIRNTRSVE